MLSFLFKRFAGRHYQKFLEKARPVVARINEFEQSYQSLTNDQLRAKTDEFRTRLKAGETLDQILPEAFATVKNAARRLVGTRALVCGHELEWNMVHFDVQEQWRVRVSLHSAQGNGETVAFVEPTPEGLGRWDLLIYLLPFLAIGFIWLRVFLSKRRFTQRR